jgi:hypothetical protein
MNEISEEFNNNDNIGLFEINISENNPNTRKNDKAGPIKMSVYNLLPENRIKDVSKLDEENKRCTICLEDFINNDKVIFLPCFHIYHKNCIEERLLKNELKPCVKCLISIDYIILNDNNNYNEIRTDKNKNKFPIINNDSYLNKTYPEQIELFYNDIIIYSINLIKIFLKNNN